MTENSGWIKIHRKTLENPAIMKDSDHLAIWFWLLLNVTHKPIKTNFAGRIVTLEPGQLICGRQKIANSLNIHESKVARVLFLFKSEQQIEQQMTNKCRLITVNNWNEYQQNEQQNEQQLNNNRTTNEQQLNTIQEVKNIRIKETIPPTPKGASGGVPEKTKKRTPDDKLSPEFLKFWSLYPAKLSRQDAIKAFARLSPADQQAAVAAVPLHCKQDRWLRGFIPFPATWLNGRRWEDDLKTNSPQDVAPVSDDDLRQRLGI